MVMLEIILSAHSLRKAQKKSTKPILENLKIYYLVDFLGAD